MTNIVKFVLEENKFQFCSVENDLEGHLQVQDHLLAAFLKLTQLFKSLAASLLQSLFGALYYL